MNVCVCVCVFVCVSSIFCSILEKKTLMWGMSVCVCVCLLRLSAFDCLFSRLSLCVCLFASTFFSIFEQRTLRWRMSLFVCVCVCLCAFVYFSQPFSQFLKRELWDGEWAFWCESAFVFLRFFISLNSFLIFRK